MWHVPPAPVLEHQEGNRGHVDARSCLQSTPATWSNNKKRWFSGCRVRLWRVVVAMEQRDSTCHAFGPRYSTGTEGGRGNERKGGSLQLRKGGVHIETDRAVELLGFAFSPGSQAACRATPAIPRSQVACGASTGEITATWAFLGCFLPEIAEISAISAKAWRNVM